MLNMRVRAVLFISLVAYLPVPAVAAEGADDARLEALEKQLKDAQQEIRELRRIIQHPGEQQHGESRVPVKEVEHPEAQPKVAPVDLLLDTLRKQGTISESDYQAIKRAMAGTKEPEQHGPAAAEGTRLSEAPVAQSHEARKTRQRAHSYPVSASYRIGSGLSVYSEDGTWSAIIRNRLQVRYTFSDRKGGDSTVGDSSSFRLRRMKTAVKGHIFSRRLRYHMQLSFAHESELDDAYLHWRPVPVFGLKAGQYQVSFNRQHVNSSAYQQFIDRSSADDFFSLGRDQGITATGGWFGPTHDDLMWSFGIFNGNGPHRLSNENVGHLGTVRILYMPLGHFNYYAESDVDNTMTPLLGFGAAYALNSQADSGAKEKAGIFAPERWGQVLGTQRDQFDIAEATADIHFKYRGFSLLGDYYWAQAAPNTAPSKTAQGYNFQTGYFIIPYHLEAAFRYAFVDRDVGGSPSAMHEFGGALGYFFLKHQLKVQADIRDLLDDLPPPGTTKHVMEYRTQVQLMF